MGYFLGGDDLVLTTPFRQRRFCLAKRWLYGNLPKMVISLQLRYLC